ncbi:peptide transporter ptr2 [Yamadazyma tenuis]|uniref:PTR2-domain-containing protein n=1 Tax=Candida tenuis (strain ATCC 10573 / BCRC 21748 / CBS 615 / JCM 9827 / NBRC 10315 / NRRL Y-1498 / VKM Y-70) TaxID=590646 RepID=G3BDW5_CANTC|nr:PTR2-domain-containing protein [Yamadazyma tenuis ATCC 10573]EGV60397.1 PTR2-domain-containing protein [Yamadazyma tenuis ATCC 10573]WEJ94356.1 peptide transporter ptr2 [Yamadazyma tenuis]
MSAVSESKIVEPRVNETALKEEKKYASSGSLKALADEDSQSSSTEEKVEATTEELKTLRHISGSIPIRCWLVAIVELAERFSYYGLSTPFQNYMQNTPSDSPAGVLSLGNSSATALSYFFQFWCYVTPIFGAWIADTYLGKFKSISVFCGIYIVGIFILFITSIPSVADKNTSLGGFVTAIIIIGIATGGVKSNVSPLIADQVPKEKPYIKIMESGERVVVDPALTIQNVFMIFYFMINIGSLSVVATTQLEKHVGFWAAYLLPFCFFFLAVIALVLGRNQYVKVPVGDKIIAKCFRILFIALKNRLNFETVKPSVKPEANYPWSDHFVDEVRRAFFACKLFCFYPIYWLVYGQMTNNFVSQAGMMELHGLPNDILSVINSLAIIVFVPLCDRVFYPLIRKFTPFKSITRIFFGFMWATGAMVYAAVLQYYVYKAGPCYDMPKACNSKYANTPNHIHIALQTPAYVLIGLSEIFANITGLEYAYTKAPVSMKSFITSLYLLTNAFGSAIGIALSPTSKNPKFVWSYTGLAVACFIAGCLFWLIFHHYNDKEEELNQLDYDKDPSEDLIPVASISHSLRNV